MPAAPAHPLERRTATSRALLRQLVVSCSLLVVALVAGAFVGPAAMPLIIGAGDGVVHLVYKDKTFTFITKSLGRPCC